MFVSNNSIVHLGKRRRYLRNNGTSFCWSRTIPDGKRVPTCDHISRPFVFWQFQWEMYLHSNSISSIQLDIILSIRYIYIYIIPIDCWFFLPHHYTTFEAHVEATTPASKKQIQPKGSAPVGQKGSSKASPEAECWSFSSQEMSFRECISDHIWLVVSIPLKNISQLEGLFPIYGKIKNVPKPPTRYLCEDMIKFIGLRYS